MDSHYIINSMNVDPVTNEVKLIDYTIEFSDDAFAGVTGNSAGLIEPVGSISGSAPASEIVLAIKERLGAELAEIEAHVSEIMRLNYIKTASVRIPGRAPTVDDVATERDRRLALGFDFDFSDTRGVHHISTSADDMRKWMDEVTPLAQSFINLGQPDGEITISTNKGMVVITAMEWQSILVAAAGYRQPLYASSFALMAMDPIPTDYATNPTYWP